MKKSLVEITLSKKRDSLQQHKPILQTSKTIVTVGIGIVINVLCADEINNCLVIHKVKIPCSKSKFCHLCNFVGFLPNKCSSACSEMLSSPIIDSFYWNLSDIDISLPCKINKFECRVPLFGHYPSAWLQEPKCPWFPQHHCMAAQPGSVLCRQKRRWDHCCLR